MSAVQPNLDERLERLERKLDRAFTHFRATADAFADALEEAKVCQFNQLAKQLFDMLPPKYYWALVGEFRYSYSQIIDGEADPYGMFKMRMLSRMDDAFNDSPLTDEEMKHEEALHGCDEMFDDFFLCLVPEDKPEPVDGPELDQMCWTVVNHYRTAWKRCAPPK